MIQFKTAIQEERKEDLYRQLLWRSIKDYLFYSSSNKLYRGAYSWLYETSKKPEIISFETVCESLQIDKEKVIFLLHSYKDKKKRNIEGVEWERFLEICSTNHGG